ncbi:MAG TPA: serine/threonine-protein kinase [Polyangiales bacterium]|jgi:serine/threonine-protein kinase|nr:serine/threonine-protein kinase [Polyangiales bacterium]
MSAPQEQHDPWLGRTVDGRFKIEQFLGVGAVGAVYRAADLQHGRPVALKIWNGRALNAQTRGRFAREAAALMTLHHTNIVDVYSCGIVDDVPYVAIEFLDGETLDQKMGNGEALDNDVAMDIAQQMLGALSYAHGLGVVHRDLKPDNVFLVRGEGGKPIVKLLDYGLAKFLSPGDDPMKGVALTMTGMVMGTPLYMAPEQAAGKAIDARVDVYAAACMLFEMCSGQPPFLGETNMELFRAHMMGPIPKLAEVRQGVTVQPALQALFDKALAKKPEERFANAGEMLAALNAVPQPAVKKKLAAEFRASIASQPGKGRDAKAPNKALLVMAGALAGALVLGVVAYLLLRH